MPSLAQPRHDPRVPYRARRPPSVVVGDQPLAEPSPERRGRDAGAFSGLVESQRHRDKFAPGLPPHLIPAAEPDGGPRRPRALRPAASAVGARHVSGGASRAVARSGGRPLTLRPIAL